MGGPVSTQVGKKNGKGRELTAAETFPPFFQEEMFKIEDGHHGMMYI